MDTHQEHDSQAERNIRHDVETHGWSICLFEADSTTPSFAYTIGLWQNFRQPEIIAFGLPIDTLHTILNDAGELVRAGNAPTPNTNNDEILKALPVQFRRVDASNISDWFGYGQWFYHYEPFPAVQLFWPDRAGRFPWEAGYDEQYEFDQPLLDNQLDFKFFEARNTATYVARQVFKEGQPILRVLHEAEGDWQFLTGDVVTAEDIMLVALEQVVKRDPTINDLFTLPRSYLATRDYVGAEWTREPYAAEEDEEE